MKKVVVIFILVSMILYNNLMTVNAHPVEIDFYQIFEEHGTIMLLIDANTGEIEHANKAASIFYGYSLEQLESMKIHEINVLSSEEVNRKMQEAAKNHKSNYILEQRLANGDIRTVEVYSCPHTYNGKTILFATVYDITDKVELEKKERFVNNILLFTLAGAAIIIGVFSFILFMSFKKLKIRNHEIESLNELRKTYINSYDNLIYLKDENLRYVFVNKAVMNFHKKEESEIIGHEDFEISDKELAEKQRETDLAVLESKTVFQTELAWKDRIFKIIKFPVKLINGHYGVGAFIEDITEAYINRKKEGKALLRNQILVDVLSRKFESVQEQLDYALNESLKLTESKYGYIYLYNEEKKEFILNSWSKDVMPDCTIVEKQIRNQLEMTGLWGEVVYQKKPIIVNDYKMPDIMKEGYPESHIHISRFMFIPVVIDNNIVAVVGLANKDYDYDYNDIYQMITLMNGVWNAKERRETLVKLAVERNKFLQTLLSIGDGVMVVNLEGEVTMLNRAAEKLTGWTIKEAEGRHYKEVFVLSHEDERVNIEDPIEKVLKTDTIQELGNNVVLTSRNGTQYYIEDSAAPIKDDRNITIGVALVFRDVTEKREQRKKIEYLSTHDSLTGLYNRVFFEEEIKRLDTKNNLPISIIMGDMNGLKLANDIFGRETGDLLLQKAADTFRKVCRAGDIIARMGGDEFIILLPKTKAEEAEDIMLNIKEQFSKEKVKAIRGSISLGYDTKVNEDDDILLTLKNAESKMYFAKTLDSSKLKRTGVKTIVSTLYEHSPKEAEHSKNVSKICENIGRAMGLPELEIRKLKEAGFLHDIGKVILDESLLNKDKPLTHQEKKKIKQHPVVGYRILNIFDYTLDLAEPVLSHHERWDGTGYPRGLKGEEIPILSRIIAVAESYDVMTNKSYKNAISHEEAILELKKNAGIKFDPIVVNKFIDMVKVDK
ncbi:MAG TPA: PAS domain-containing protein [Clostridiaceae bacterium]|nr:PAS domain-containing protein [Clostridiaceae bacterium]